MKELFMESIDQFLKLYEIQRDTLNKRREIEWKISISFWSTIIIGTGYLLNKITLPVCSGVYYLILLIIFSVWVGKVYHSSEVDHSWIKVYKSWIEKSIGISIDIIKYEDIETNAFICFSSIWWWSQVLISTLFLFASWYLLKLQ